MTDADWEPRPFRKDQEAAIDMLERALARCKRQGLRICGMDDELLAYREDNLASMEEACGDLYNAQVALSNKYAGTWTVNDHGAYRDSGGW